MKKFKLTIDGFALEIDPADLPYDEIGRAGSLLDIARSKGIRINHTCGGACACTTCHVYVRRGLEDCEPPQTNELNRLEEVWGREENSRLACQCVPRGNQDIEVEIP